MSFCKFPENLSRLISRQKKYKKKRGENKRERNQTLKNSKVFDESTTVHPQKNHQATQSSEMILLIN